MEDKKLEKQLALANIYLNEYIHRAETFTVHVYKIFYAALVVMLLPNVPDGFLNITLPVGVFRAAGLIMTFLFLIVSYSYAKRLEASNKTYHDILNTKIEPNLNYERIKLEDLETVTCFKKKLKGLEVSISREKKFKKFEVSVFRKKKVKETKVRKWILNRRISFWIYGAMFFILLAVNVLLIIYDLS